MDPKLLSGSDEEVWDAAARACGLAAVAFAVATPLVAGALTPHYDRCAQFISELGAVGAPHASWVRFAGFLPTGVLGVLFAGLSLRTARDLRARWGLLLFSGVGWAYVVAAVFPCDPGCPVSGSASQQIHSAFGLVEYLGGGIGLALLAGSGPGGAPRPAVRWLAGAGAAVVLAGFVGMLVPALEPVRGAVQRAAEGALFLWLTVASWGRGRRAR